MTLQQMRKILPGFAVGLGMVAKTTKQLRAAVEAELEDYYSGDNPLEPKQVTALRTFLRKVGPSDESR